MTQKRLHYIDVAKGILILLVVIWHLPQAGKELGIVDTLFDKMQTACKIGYVSFFMPAFFIITGYFTNFAKPFKTFLWNNVRTLLIPAFCLGALANVIGLLSQGCAEPMEYLKLGFGTFLKYGGPYWFISALFVAKMMHWCVCRTTQKELIKLTIGGGDLLIACWLATSYGFFEPWYFLHAMALMIFLQIGELAKKHVKKDGVYTALGCVYILLAVALCLTGINIPFVTAGMHCAPVEAPLLLALATLGTALVLSISMKIDKSRWLEYLGRYSLIIYALHIAVLKIMLRFAIPYYGCGTISSIAATTISFLASIAALVALIKLISTKYLSWMTGKFELPLKKKNN